MRAVGEAASGEGSRLISVVLTDRMRAVGRNHNTGKTSSLWGSQAQEQRSCGVSFSGHTQTLSGHDLCNLLEVSLLDTGEVGLDVLPAPTILWSVSYSCRSPAQRNGVPHIVISPLKWGTGDSQSCGGIEPLKGLVCAYVQVGLPDHQVEMLEMLKLKMGKYITERFFYVTGSDRKEHIPILWKQVFSV